MSGKNACRRTVAVALAALLAISAALVTGCGSSAESAEDQVHVVAYSTPQQAYENHLQPAFNDTADGAATTFANSFGASGDQSRAVESGQDADVVNFALETDMTRLVDSGKVADDWQENRYRGIVTNSVVALVVRPGNPRNVKSFAALARGDIEVVTPNPFTSGGARWNIMAIYGAALEAGKTPDQALEEVKAVLAKTPAQPESARVALQAFLDGAGDVLISYENEAIAARLAGEDIEYVVPDSTILIEQPAAVTTDAPPSAERFLDFLWSDAGQKIWAEQGYRPVKPALVDRDRYPSPKKLFTIADLGGWDRVTSDFFDPENGSIARINRELGMGTS